MLMLCHATSAIIRFIITEPAGRRPEAEVIISLILHEWA